MAKQQTTAHIRERALNDFKQQLALEKFQEERPQLWLQAQRIGKLIKIQNRLDNETFPEGSCFLHAATVSFSSFCVKKVLGVDLDTCQVSIEIYGDEHLEAGVVVLPVETVEWFGFPAQAVSTGIHFEGFTSGAFTKSAPLTVQRQAFDTVAPAGRVGAGDPAALNRPITTRATRKRKRPDRPLPS
jgi:hypothetical protein